MIDRLRSLRPLIIAVIVLCPLVLGLTGCAKLFTEPPRPLYRITVPADFPPNLRHVPAQLVIALPDAPGGLDTPRIAISRSPVSLDYLADGEWVERAPAMLRAVLIQAFENSRAVAGVGPDSFSLRADFVVESDLRHFEAVYDSSTQGEGKPVVSVVLGVKLVRVPEHKVVAQTLISAREPAAANGTPQIAVAFDTAVASVARQVVNWTVSQPALSARSK